MIKWFGSFLFSSRRMVYIKVASQFKTALWRVYELAYGSKVRSNKEDKILQELKEQWIVSIVCPFGCSDY